MHNQPREPQPYEDCQEKSISRIWVNFIRNGLRLGSRHQEPPHTDVLMNLATVVVRGILPWLRRRNGLLPSGPKSSFQMRASFVFHLETKVLSKMLISFSSRIWHMPTLPKAPNVGFQKANNSPIHFFFYWSYEVF